MSKVERNSNETNLEQVKAQIPPALLASLNLLGPVGSVLSTALGGYLTNKRIENIEDTLCAMGDNLKGIDPRRIEDYVRSDEFMHLFLTTLQKAQIEHQEDKKRSYGVMLANMAVDTETAYDQKSMFLSALAEIELLHLKILKYLADKARAGTDEERWASLDEIRSAGGRLSQNSSYVPVSVLQKLASCGFVMSKGESDTKPMTGVNPVGLWFHSLYRITDLGETFLQFLKA